MRKEIDSEGFDCKELFKKAYENRYTWGPHFCGYRGKCSLEEDDLLINGSFLVNKKLHIEINNIIDDRVEKEISSQLHEVTIHRVRRDFEQVHGSNIFTAGKNDQFGIEVLIGGKSQGDKYKVKDNIITMVYRHIHGLLININTIEVFDTGMGYLSKKYTSQYFEPNTLKPKSGLSFFSDIYQSLAENGPWVLSERVIECEEFQDKPSSKKKFSFHKLDLI